MLEWLRRWWKKEKPLDDGIPAYLDNVLIEGIYRDNDGNRWVKMDGQWLLWDRGVVKR
jgi:hypothetical protein